MRHLVSIVLAAAFVGLAPAPSLAVLSNYSQNFEGLVQANPTALSGDGWLVFGNVFDGTTSAYLYGYGPFPAPNDAGNPAFCLIAAGEGGPPQGTKQLVVFSDYLNADHANGNLIESNVFQEQVIGSGDVGHQWVFQFDAKLGDIAGSSTAFAFIKTLHPTTFALTTFLTEEMTAIPVTWSTFEISIIIDPALEGHILQFGFLSNATNYETSGIFYDNITFTDMGTVSVPRLGGQSAFELRQNAPNPFMTSTSIDFTLAEGDVVDLGVYDIAGRRVATVVHGEMSSGPHRVAWNGKGMDGSILPTGVYRYVLTTSSGRASRSMVLSR